MLDMNNMNENINNDENTKGIHNTNSPVPKSFWFEITKEDRYITVNELMSDDGDQFTYYFLLILSSVIIPAGILLANSAILIGGMLITPLLTPVLLIALGMTTGNTNLISRSIKKISKSLLIIFGISFLVSLIFTIPQNKEFFNSVLFTNTTDSAFLYFLVAFAAGIAATFAWIRKKVDNMLPGIAIAVSLVPPIAMVGVFMAGGEFDLARFFFMVFLFNITGIIGGSMILFSMFRFYHSDNIIKNNLEKITLEEENKTKDKRINELEDQKKAIKKAEKTINSIQEEILREDSDNNNKYENNKS
jgi:uncharacterized hydrophobic protein (TIGR00271 family)